jgi:hypothetical protein
MTYATLGSIAIIFGVMGFIGFVLWLISGFDCAPLAIISLLCLITVIGVSVKRADIEKAETTRVEETVVATVTSKEIVVDSNHINHYYLSVDCGDGEVFTVNKSEYASLTVGDNVSVKKITETLFGEEDVSYRLLEG